jgi:plasmid stability protein
LPDDLLRRAKALAAERGISMAELFRETLENGLKGQQPKPKAIGMFESDEDSDLGRQSGEMKFEPRSWR